jgi:hypothetical protein
MARNVFPLWDAPTGAPDAVREPVLEDEDQLVQDWRAEQLNRLGLSWLLARIFAPLVDWHVVADLVERGCPPELALEIVR